MRFYERALPEMLHFRDSREIMYEVPLFLLPFRRSLLSIRTHLRLRRFPYGKSRFVTYNSTGRGKGKKEGERERERERERTSRTDKQSSENEPQKSAATDFPTPFFPSFIVSLPSLTFPLVLLLLHFFPLFFCSSLFFVSFLAARQINYFQYAGVLIIKFLE